MVTDWKRYSHGAYRITGFVLETTSYVLPSGFKVARSEEYFGIWRHLLIDPEIYHSPLFQAMREE